MTLVSGTALCEECNARQQDQLDENTAALDAAQERLQSLSLNLPPGRISGF